MLLPNSWKLTARQDEVHFYFGLHLNRLAVEFVGAVSPLPHRLDCGLHQHGMAAQYLQIFDGTVTADHRSRHHQSLDADLPCQRRIVWLDPMDQIPFHHPRDRRVMDGRRRRRRQHMIGAEYGIENSASRIWTGGPIAHAQCAGIDHRRGRLGVGEQVYCRRDA